MKATRGQIEKALDAPPPAVRFLLLYGPDEAGSAALAKRMERAMGASAERIDLDLPTLRDDPARLSDEAAAFSMFGDRRWIKIASATDDIVPALTALLENGAAANPVLAIGGALKGTSKLVKLALDHPAALAFISYAPDAREADQIVVALAREQGLRLSSDLARRINDLAGGDRTLAAGEVEKIALYLDAAPDRPAEATAEALAALGAETLDDDAAPLVAAVFSGDLSALQREFIRIRTSGTAMAAVMRPLLTRAMLIGTIRAEFDRSGRLDAAVESAGKAVFWKEKGAVARQVKLWDAPGIARVIQRLGAAERATRSSRNAGDVLVRQELLAIARQAAKGR